MKNLEKTSHLKIAIPRPGDVLEKKKMKAEHFGKSIGVYVVELRWTERNLYWIKQHFNADQSRHSNSFTYCKHLTGVPAVVK